MMLGKLIDLTGHDLAFAANGWEALLALDNSHVDLILLDMMMPGMDGPTFLKILQQGAKKRNVPVAVITALDEDEAKKCIGNLETVAVLRKGADLVDSVLTLIQTMLAPSPTKNRRSGADSPSN
jgi:CheY-like chemotaxis protein